jgi:general secretion pathway protein C
VETFLRKYLWMLDAAVVAACSALLALSAASLVKSRFSGLTVASRPGFRLRTSPYEPAHNKRPDAILRRNMFCSTCPPILDGEGAPDAGTDNASPELQATTLPLKLVAVMFAPSSNEQKWNTAVIRDNDSKTIGAFAVGAQVDGATLVDILNTRVYLNHAGTTEYLDLLSPPKAAPPASPRPAPPPRPKGDTFSLELDRGIKKVGEHSYELQRSTLESVLGNIALLSRSARIVPDIRGGKPYGFRLFAVRPDGPFAKIGLQNGDVIVSINGLEMTSPEKALEVYGKLKSASHLALGLERTGKKLSQDYTIR